MRKYTYLVAALFVLAFSGCATRSGKGVQAVPAPVEGEAAVFGKVRLVEHINNLIMPVQDNEGALYLVNEASDVTIKVMCSETGDIGVYLPAGDYRVERVDIQGYLFMPDITLKVPEGTDAAYAGTIVLDGTPTGVEVGTGDSRFIITVKDEFAEFSSALKKASPGSEEKVSKSLFRASSSVATGEYPTKVLRSSDIEATLEAKTRDVESAVYGGFISLMYVINPVWLFAY